MVRRLLRAWFIVSIALIGSSSHVRAVEPLPYGPYGTVTLNGAWVPDGTPVRAFCDGVEVGSGTTQTLSGASRYSISVEGDDSETTEIDGCLPDETVSFTVDGWATDQTGTWVEGKSEEINLTAFRPEPAIDLEKATNGSDADSPPGPAIQVGGGITWTYAVTNTGNITLTNVTVTDDILGAIACPQTTLSPVETMVCTATGTAEAGAYANLATATGAYISTVVSATDVSHYFGEDPVVDIEKSTNGVDGDRLPGVFVTEGQAITWTYRIINTGNVEVSSIFVTDSELGTISCPQTALAADAAMTCETYGTAFRGQYQNTGWVTATAPTGLLVSDADPSAYYGAAPSMAFNTLTQGQDADVGPGPYVRVGTPVAWTYAVTNTGNITLTGVTVTDSQGVTVSCPAVVLAAGAAMECSASGTAVAGVYRNEGTVIGLPWVGAPLTVTDPSHYFGIDPTLKLEKATNGVDADTGTGPLIPLRDPVTWTYAVTNTGNITLTGVSVVDDVEGPVDCPQTRLGSGEEMTCEVAGTAAVGQYANGATATGIPPVGPDVDDADASHYFGTAPAVTLEKSTQGIDADTQPGPYLLVGEFVTWTYVISNTGNISVSLVSLYDDQIGEIADACPATILDAGAAVTCTASALVVAGQYANHAEITAMSPVGELITDTDSSHYFGAVPVIQIEKATNGLDADESPGPVILEGQPVTWTYGITNTGNVTLTAVTVQDDRVGLIDCPLDALNPGERQTCEAAGTTVAGQYRNLATVTGLTPGGLGSVSATDPSHYFSYTPYPSVGLEKRVNGVLTPEPPGLYVTAGEALTWTYLILNTGNTELLDLSVVDDQGTPADPTDDREICGVDALDAQATTVCTSTGIAEIGAYVNVAAVTGTSPTNDVLSATARSHYYGVVPGLAFEKATQEEDADTGPGPLISVGEEVTWTYVVTNTGNITLTDIAVTDDQGVAVICPDTILASQMAMQCEATDIAVAGVYRNVGRVSARPWVGEVLTGTDPSHYYGVAPAIRVEKATNGVDADVAPGPYVPFGDSVTWTYAVTNTGNVTLTGVTVTDDILSSVDCPQTTLAVQEGMVCAIDGTAIEGPYANMATATGTSPLGSDVFDTDLSHYFGSAPTLAFEKLTLERDTDTTDGPVVWVGNPVTWTYALTNTGNVTVTQIAVVDDREGVVVCPGDVLVPEESLTCYGYGSALEGPYTNVGTVSALAADGTVITASDRSHYRGVVLDLSVRLLLSIDGGATWLATDPASAPAVLSGADLRVHLVITNTGSITVTDMGWASDALDLTTCGVPETLAPDQVWTCTLSLPWGANLRGLDVEISAAAVDDAGMRRARTERDTGYYYGAVPELIVKKFVSGDDGNHWYDADTSPGPLFPSDARLRFRMVVTNTGNVPLRALSLEDDALDLNTCPWDDPFAVDDGLTCEISGSWQAGEHVNTVTATGRFTDDTGTAAFRSDSDRAYYFGSVLGLFVEKRVASDSSRWYDADLVTDALTITVETPISWQLIVSNTGTVPLAISLLDELDGLPLELDSLCDEVPPDALSPGSGYQCTYEDSATSESPGTHVNRLSVEGTYEGSHVSLIDEAYVIVRQYRVYLPVLFR